MHDDRDTLAPSGRPRPRSWPPGPVARTFFTMVLPTLVAVVTLYARFVLLEADVSEVRGELSEHIHRGGHQATESAIQGLVVHQAETARDIQAIRDSIASLDRQLRERLDLLQRRGEIR